ncbi:MAG: 1,4-dihydroxy-2-naphthoate polyprenyltransferase [Verrucomicrobiota bacterium]
MRKTIPLRVWLLAARPKTLPAAVVPVALGTALAASDGRFQLIPALVCVLFALLIQVGTNFANDYFDYRSGADNERRIGPTRAVAAGLVPPALMWRATLIVLALAFCLGLILIVYGGWWLLLVGVFSVLCAVAYTGGPYPLGYHGLGDVFVLLFFGFVAVMFTYYVQADAFTWGSFWTGLGAGLLINNLLVVNNARDIKTDREAGKLTLPARFGFFFAVGQYGISVLIAFAIPDFLYHLGYSGWVFLSMLGLPLGLLLTLMLLRADRPARFQWLLSKTALLLILYGVLLSVGILIG